MSSGGNVCLRLNGFENNVKMLWQEIQMEDYLCDITLACEDKLIRTHKFVISSYSPVLKNILKNNQTPHPVIYLRRVKYRNLQNLLNFMYQGEVNVAEEDLSSFLEVAEEINIRGRAEGNSNGFTSNSKDTIPLTHQNIHSYPKGGKTDENNIIENILDNIYIDQFNKFVQAPDKLIKKEKDINKLTAPTEIIIKANNDNNRLFAPVEIQSEEANPIGASSNKQSIMLTLADCNDEISHQCSQCDYKTIIMSNLWRHINSIHEGIRYSCDQCDHKATNKTVLKRTIRSIHEDEHYPCDQCDYKAS